jgi:hypothetical protein
MVERFMARVGTIGAILILAAAVLVTGIGGGVIEHYRLAAQQQQGDQSGDQSGGQGASQEGQTGTQGESKQGEQGTSGSQQEDQAGTQGQSQEGESASTKAPASSTTKPTK